MKLNCYFQIYNGLKIFDCFEKYVVFDFFCFELIKDIIWGFFLLLIFIINYVLNILLFDYVIKVVYLKLLFFYLIDFRFDYQIVIMIFFNILLNIKIYF